MKKASTRNPISSADDSLAMTEAIEHLRASGYPLFRPTPHQLKIRDVSYYPNKGTIVVDGKTQEAEKGLAALQRILESLYGPAPRSGTLILDI